MGASAVDGVQMKEPELGIEVAMVSIGTTLVEGPLRRRSVTVPVVVFY